MLEKDLSALEKKSQIIKVHKQFGHASIDNLKKLIKNAGLLDKELCNIINDVVESCDTCIRFKKAPPRPIVGLSKASDFNDTVSVDLHQLHSDLYYLHMIDEFTRYSNAVIIKKKSFNESLYSLLDRYIWCT